MASLARSGSIVKCPSTRGLSGKKLSWADLEAGGDDDAKMFGTSEQNVCEPLEAERECAKIVSSPREAVAGNSEPAGMISMPSIHLPMLGSDVALWEEKDAGFPDRGQFSTGAHHHNEIQLFDSITERREETTRPLIGNFHAEQQKSRNFDRSALVRFDERWKRSQSELCPSPTRQRQLRL